MKKYLVAIFCFILLCGCGEPKSVDELVDNPKLLEKTLDKCDKEESKYLDTGKRPSEKIITECLNAEKAEDIIFKENGKQSKLDLKKKKEKKALELEKVMKDDFAVLENEYNKCLKEQLTNFLTKDISANCLAAENVVNNKINEKINSFKDINQTELQSIIDVCQDKSTSKINNFATFKYWERLNIDNNSNEHVLLSYAEVFENLEDRINCTAAIKAWKKSELVELKDSNYLFEACKGCNVSYPKFDKITYPSLISLVACNTVSDLFKEKVLEKADEIKGDIRKEAHIKANCKITSTSFGSEISAKDYDDFENFINCAATIADSLYK